MNHSVMLIAWFGASHDCGCYYVSCSAVALRRRKVSGDIQLRKNEAAAPEKVHYSTGASVVQLGQNLAYGAVKYPDEAIYEYPT